MLVICLSCMVLVLVVAVVAIGQSCWVTRALPKSWKRYDAAARPSSPLSVLSGQTMVQIQKSCRRLVATVPSNSPRQEHICSSVV